MNLDDLKGNFNLSNQEEFNKDTVLQMLQIHRHPVLKRIGFQLFAESIGWIIFLSLYYNAFDGHQKPAIWNIMLILVVCLVLVHNLLGFSAVYNPIGSGNLSSSIDSYFLRLKRYAKISVISRVLALLLLIGFFLSGIKELQPRHYWSLLILLPVIAVQVFWLNRIWKKRIDIISNVKRQFL